MAVELANEMAVLSDRHALIGLKLVRRIIELSGFVCPVHGAETNIRVELTKRISGKDGLSFEACCDPMARTVGQSIEPYLVTDEVS